MLIKKFYEKIIKVLKINFLNLYLCYGTCHILIPDKIRKDVEKNLLKALKHIMKLKMIKIN